MESRAVELWTIGHSTRTIEEFLGLLRGQQIGAIADVRRFPGSRRHPHFGMEQLSESLKRAGIEYVHFEELGGRRKAQPGSRNTAWRLEAFRGYADYMETDGFHAGIERLLSLAGRARTCMMCAEALWWQCHRALISDWLKARGHIVRHILAAGKVQEHPFTSAARLVCGALSYQSSGS